jgi:predicted alpha/beta-hydrolase family hydrolase
VASAGGTRRLALVGRSFGGRVCARLAAAEPDRAAALVLLGHPVAPPGRPRPADERALETVRCPTLVVQGAADRLGPLAVLERIVAANPRLELRVLPGVGHNFGRQESTAAALATAWLQAIFGRDAVAPTEA